MSYKQKFAPKEVLCDERESGCYCRPGARSQEELHFGEWLAYITLQDNLILSKSHEMEATGTSRFKVALSHLDQS